MYVSLATGSCGPMLRVLDLTDGVPPSSLFRGLFVGVFPAPPPGVLPRSPKNGLFIISYKFLINSNKNDICYNNTVNKVKNTKKIINIYVLKYKYGAIKEIFYLGRTSKIFILRG